MKFSKRQSLILDYINKHSASSRLEIEEYVATVDMNGIIKVWNTMNGQLIKTLEGPEEAEWICWHNKVNERERLNVNNKDFFIVISYFFFSNLFLKNISNTYSTFIHFKQVFKKINLFIL